jgi:hypothetical protein
MRLPSLRSPDRRPDERPAPGAVTAASVFGLALLLLAALSPAAALSVLFAAAFAAAARERR